MKHHKPMTLRPTLKALAASRRVAVRRLETIRVSGKPPSPTVTALLTRIQDIDAHIQKITTPKAS